mmetsp:Transcript_84321/g.149036  ORF Transcript_84321/g.149036 Transcript_84321/m.149036 type:complete len:234 (+) Transcript_84321:623-1324(+)
MAAFVSLSCSANKARSLLSCLMVASIFSSSALMPSAASLFSLRVASLAFSSSSHQAFFVASESSCSCSFFTMSSIMVFTLAIGSDVTLSAMAASSLLCSFSARCCSNWATCCSPGLRRLLSCAKAWPWTRLGRCLSALPATASPEIISMAFPTASSSSLRSFCLASKSAVFFFQSISRSFLYFVSASRSDFVSSSSASAAALSCRIAAFCLSFALLSEVASLLSASREATTVA